MTLITGAEVKVLEKFGDGWWKVAALSDNQSIEQIGLYPSNYLKEDPASFSFANTPTHNNNKLQITQKFEFIKFQMIFLLL